MRSDGAIIFRTELDNKGLEKDLAQMKKTIQRQEDSISINQKMRLPLKEQSDALVVQLDRAKETLYKMQNASVGAFSKDQLEEQRATVAGFQAQWNVVQKQVESYDKKIQKATLALEQNKERAGEIAEQLSKVNPAAQKMADAMERAQNSSKRFALRMKEVIRSALVFTLITQTLAQFREWMGKVIKTNDEASAAVARLKGALLTLAQPLVNVIIPAFTTLVNVLAAVAGEVAKIVSALFGTTVDQSAAAAESLQEEVDALDATGAAAKKAGRSLASFDEINQLSSTDSSSGGGGAADIIVPDFSWADGISEKLQQIARDVLLIAAGLALWKLSGSLPGQLGTIIGKLGGLMVALGGAALFYEGLTDAWENGVDWENLATMIAGVTAAAFGLWVVFGNIGAGIALVVGGIAMLVTGFKDIMENGINLQNVLLVLAGIVATGLGFFFLTGSVIPLVVAGIAGIIFALAALTGNGEQLIGNLMMIFEGFVDFIAGVFTGDIERAGEGICKMVTGLINTVLTVVGSLINAIIKGLNWLIGKINSVSFSVPDWVPLVGGKNFSPNIPRVKEWTIPQLATGAVIPPNWEFLAVLGDQTSGNNIEAPESLIRKIVREEAGGGENTALLQAILEAIKSGKVMMVDKRVLARIAAEGINDMTIAAGKPVLLY